MSWKWLAAGMVVGLVLLVGLLGPLAWWLTGDADALDATRQTILQGTAGLLGVVGLFYTVRTYMLSREGQLTDRYGRAVDQLGADVLSRRVGGVFALERVMRESTSDQWAVIEVLVAHIRERSEKADIHRQRDVQAALTVLGRRPHAEDRELDRIRLGDADLRNTLLRDGCLDRAAFRGARLDDVHWERTSLVEATFQDAFLTRADFVGVILRKAELTGTDLTDARLQGADLTGADLTGANLRGAHLSGVSGDPVLSEAQLEDVHCRPEERCHQNRSAFTA